MTTSIPSTPASPTVRSARPSDRAFVLDLAERLVAFDVPAHRPKAELVEGDRRALARERGSDRLTLSALVTNARARALYDRRGFDGEYIRYVLLLRPVTPGG